MQDVLPAKVAKLIKNGISQVLKSNSLVTMEYSLPLPHGENIFEARLSPILNKHILVIVRNITERRRAEEALKLSEARFRSLIENSPLGICIHRNNTILFANQAYLDMFGYGDHSEVYGISVLNNIAPECR